MCRHEATNGLYYVEDNLDRVSALPEHLIEKILMRLSLRDAVRTSILSSKWRYKWTTLPWLVFDDKLSPSEGEKCIEKLTKVIDTVLLLHRGPINSFQLLQPKLPAISDIDRWICIYQATLSIS